MPGGAPSSSKSVGSSSEPCPLQKCSIFVQVLRADTKEVVGGAGVQLKGTTSGDQTTARGTGIAQYDSIPAGRYQLALALSGTEWKKFKAPPAQRLALRSGESKSVLFELIPPGSLQLRVVRSDTQEPVEGAKVLVTGPEDLGERVSPNAGWLDYQEVLPGQYRIRTSLEGELLERFQAPPILTEDAPAGSAKRITVGLDPVFNCWIEVEVLDDQGHGVPHEPYWIRLPNDQVREGTLDSRGMLRLEKIPCGDCLVRFPKLDSTECQPLPPGDDHDWLEIELVDDRDRPLANEPYRVKCPDGTIREGTLGKNGRARVENIKPGTCKVTFPKLDAMEVKPA